ncbi:NAD-dependent epimerase/dehydratase family protein [Haloparvum sp. AD34]
MTDSDTENTTEPTPDESQPTIAVTGAAGYIGSRVVWHLQEEHPDWEIVALDNFYLGDVRSIRGVDVEHVDIRNRDRLEDALSGADVVLHLAAISGVDDCEENQDLAYEVNVIGTSNVAWFCRKTGAALAFPFSMAVLGDPAEFPITADLPRDPMNWYGRTKVLGEDIVDAMADGAFPAHTFLKSNLYGEHVVNGERVSKGTVINFFVDRALSGETLTVYEPGTQSRNFIHVDDVARAYVDSTEQLLADLEAGETGVTAYEIASDEDPSVTEVAEIVQRLASEVANEDVDIELRENPRSGETLVDEFGVDTSRTEAELGWGPERTVEESVRSLLEANQA